MVLAAARRRHRPPLHGQLDRGPATTSDGLLALIGVFDFVGTIASGWLTDKVDSRYLLFGCYLLRGLSLLVLPALLGPELPGRDDGRWTEPDDPDAASSAQTVQI